LAQSLGLVPLQACAGGAKPHSRVVVAGELLGEREEKWKKIYE
jgi:hypothetical protein